MMLTFIEPMRLGADQRTFECGHSEEIFLSNLSKLPQSLHQIPIRQMS